MHRFASWATSRGLPTFGSPWASCSHLVLSNSSQFASFFFVHLPLRFRLTPRITQRVPIPFQHRARAVNPYPIIRFKPMSFFHYFLTLLTLLLRLLHLVSITYPVSSNATSPKALFPSPISFPTFLLSHQSRPSTQRLNLTLYPTCYTS